MYETSPTGLKGDNEGLMARFFFGEGGYFFSLFRRRPGGEDQTCNWHKEEQIRVGKNRRRNSTESRRTEKDQTCNWHKEEQTKSDNREE